MAFFFFFIIKVKLFNYLGLRINKTIFQGCLGIFIIVFFLLMSKLTHGHSYILINV